MSVPTMSQMRRVVFAVTVLVLAGGLTACGSGVKSTVDPVAAAATKTADAGGVRADLSVTVTQGGTPLTMTAHGWFGRDEGELVADVSSLLGALGGGSGGDGSFTARYLTEDGDVVMYLQLGSLASMLPGGKQWIRLDVEKAGKAMGFDLSKLMGGSQNPTESLELLQATGAFSSVGTETLDGVRTTHYRGTIDLDKAAAARGLPSDMIERLRQLGAPEQYPADVWIDDSGYIRRFETTYAATAAGKTTSMKMRMDLSDYGMTVAVSAPPDDEVFDVTELATQGLSSALAQHPGG
jgi:hypothetical protein